MINYSFVKMAWDLMKQRCKVNAQTEIHYSIQGMAWSLVEWLVEETHEALPQSRNTTMLWIGAETAQQFASEATIHKQVIILATNSIWIHYA